MSPRWQIPAQPSDRPRVRSVSNTTWLDTRAVVPVTNPAPGWVVPAAQDTTPMMWSAGTPTGGSVMNWPVRLVSEALLSSTCHQYRMDGGKPVMATFTLPSASADAAMLNSVADMVRWLATAIRTAPASIRHTNVAPQTVVDPTLALMSAIRTPPGPLDCPRR